MDKKTPLKYRFTQDAKQLQQYHRLRKLIYATDLGLDISPKPDRFDPESHTLVVLNRHRCAGGVRITVCNAHSNRALPMETEDFQLRHLLPELHLEQCTYAEISRLILLNDYRDGEVTRKIYKEINRKCRQLDVQYLFAITPYIQARRYMLSSRQLGFNITMADLKIPDAQKARYGGMAECLLILSQKPDQLAAVPVKPIRDTASITFISGKF